MKRLLLLFLLVGSFLLSANAQQKTITGTVTSTEDGSPIIGATVQVKGTSTGTATDLDGHYTILASEGQILVFRYTGQKTTEVTVTATNKIDVALAPDLLALDEVVVVAYGVQRKEAKTGAVSEVKSDKIQDVPETSVDKMLAGKVAGMTVTASSGQPGGFAQVRIRGISSVNAGNDPLYVIDGVAVMTGDQSYFTNTSNPLSALNPSDIESISVLKDAAAASLYGSRAANGVIIITTKSGKAGQKSTISFRTTRGFERMANDNHYGVMTPAQVLAYDRDAIKNAGQDPDDSANAKYYYPMSLLNGPTYDWMNAVTRDGMIFTADMSVQGGNDKTGTFISGSYEKNDGIVYANGFEKYQIRANINHAVNDKVKIANNFNGSYSRIDDVPMQSLYYANPLFGGMIMSPFHPIYNADGSFNLTGLPENNYTNPLANAKYDKQWEKQYRASENLSVSYEIFKGLTAKTTNSFEYASGEGVRYWSPKSDSDPTVTTGTLQVSRTQYTMLTTSNTLNYNKIFGKHSLSILAGQEAIRYDDNSYYVYSPDVNPDIPYISTGTAANDDADYGTNTYTLLSFFGRADYSFNDKYILEGSIRRDGSSRFGKDTRWGTFWSAAASWNVNKEAFLRDVTWLNQLKLRASYGVSGNYNIGNYQQYGLYGSVSYAGVTAWAPSNPANNKLTWENNGEYNLAVEFALFGRLSGQVDVYSRKTTDMLLDYPLSYTSGFSSIKMNIGSLKNTGYELLLNYSVIEKKDLKWDVGFNISHNKSELLDLGKDDQIVSSPFIKKVGEKFYTYYLFDYAGVNPANGEALWYNADGKLTNLYAQARRKMAGSPEPKFIGGANTTVSYKGLSLDVSFEFKTGNKVFISENRYLNSDGYYFNNNNQAVTALDYWKKPGDITRNPKPVYKNTSNSSAGASTRWLYPGDYLRIKNITLSYSLPKAWVQKATMQSARIYASAVNLYTFHKVDFWDPERGVDGAGSGIYPMTKKMIVGLEFTF